MAEDVGGEDPQKLKKMSAAAYDYSDDPRWTEYWSNVLIPPHLSSRPDVKLHFQRKFYQRYIDPDLEVEPMSMSSSSQSARSPSQTAQSSSSTTPDQPRSYSSGTANRPAGSSTAASSTPTSLRWDRKTIQFSVNAWVFVVGVLAIFPLAPKNISNRAYRLSLMGTACSSLYSLYSLYGKPRAWNLQAVQVWFQSVIITKDFMYLIYCLTFVTSHLYLKFALIPILCRALEDIAKFLRRNFSRSTLYRREAVYVIDELGILNGSNMRDDDPFLQFPIVVEWVNSNTASLLSQGKYLEDACVWVESNTTTLSSVSSQAEIGLGFLLILSLFSWQRNIIQAFMYWQLLKLMYHAPATAGYHQNVWTKIDRSCNPLVQRYAPFLNSPISAIKRWWLR